jgi:hypothetical protein
MPPRWLSLAIVAFWLGTTGWLFWSDLWPRYRPGNPPRVTIELTEEAHQGDRPREIRWTVSQNGKDVLSATTYVRYNERDDSFSLHADFRPVFKGGGTVRNLTLNNMTSSYRLTREGRLLGMVVDFDLGTAEFHITGDVQDGVFAPRLRYTVLDKPQDLKLPEVRLPDHCSMLQPLHPVNRIEDLRPGQTWREPCFNPLADSLKALPLLGGGGSPERYLSARVLPETRPFTLQRQEKTCLVIEYVGDDITVHTWVEQSSGLVLCQEADLEGDVWVMRRDMPP